MASPCSSVNQRSLSSCRLVHLPHLGPRKRPPCPGYLPWWMLTAMLVAGCGPSTEEVADTISTLPPIVTDTTPTLPPLVAEAVSSVTMVDGPSLAFRYMQPDEASAQWARSELRLYHLEAGSAVELEALLAWQAPWESGLYVSPAFLPPDLGDLMTPRKKALFFKSLLPIVAFHNRVSADRRRRLLAMQEQQRLTEEDRGFLDEMCSYYLLEDVQEVLSTRADTLRVLLRRAGPIPPSLALAQAAIESGWGSSRFSRLGNNLFGQRIWDTKAGGLEARGARGARFRLATYPTVSASVRSYMRNLNTHAAYRGFRTVRHQMGDGRTDPLRLAAELEGYSTRRRAYVEDVIRMIRTNRLTKFDSLSRSVSGSRQ